MATTLIRDIDWLATMDGERRMIQSGAVLIEEDRIVAVGKSADISPAGADDVIDGRGKLVLPGLVDTHVHHTQHCGRGLADESDVTKHLVERLYGYEKELSADDAYWAAKACQLELIRAGTTCFVDPGSYFPGETARAVSESGLRGIIARTAFDLSDSLIGKFPEKMFTESREDALTATERLIKEHDGSAGGRIKAWVALRILSGCSDELIVNLKKIADDNDVGIVLHASESRDEVVASRLHYGVSDVERLDRLGVLGPRMILIHMGWASPREIGLCKTHDLKVSCSPSAGYRLGMGSMEFGHFAEMLEFGICVSLGSDSAMSSNFLDVVRNMYLVAGGTKSARLNATLMPPEQVLEMGTVQGARAADWQDEVGSLEVGKKADIAIFDTVKPEWRPVLNPIANLVYSSRGGADTVIADGQVIMREGTVLTIDEADTLRECQARGERIAEASGLWELIKPKWPIE